MVPAGSRRQETMSRKQASGVDPGRVRITLRLSARNTGGITMASTGASAAKATLGVMRSAIGNFYANSAISGTVAYPTLVQLQTLGTVMQEALPNNPYNSDATIAAATWNATPPVTGTNGYNYDAVAGRVWLNSTTASVNEHLW